MQHLDTLVAEQALNWLNEGETVWFCTVLSTFGSSPREPGSTMVARANGQHTGSLSGGCVEDDFLERLQQGEFAERVRQERYGEGGQSDRPGCVADYSVQVIRGNSVVMLEALERIV